MKRIVLFVVILHCACTYYSNLDSGKYFPCGENGWCPEGCTCLDNKICVPNEPGKPADFCHRCPEGYKDCDRKAQNGCETDITATAHCGACGNDCGENSLCLKNTDGEYACQCKDGRANCDNLPGCETDIATDENNCGGCDVLCSGPEKICDPNGDVVSVSYECNDKSCRQNQQSKELCQSQCNTANPCRCFQGKCWYQVCGSALCSELEFCHETNVCACGKPGDFVLCDQQSEICCPEGCRRIDQQNCGACDKVCQSNMRCDVTNEGQHECFCMPGYADCVFSAPGCETDITRDPHCGACGKNCPSNAFCRYDPSNNTASCESCTGYSRDCDNNPANGCETDVKYNNLNCGDCGNICGQKTCCGGQCLDLKTDPNNCGQCKNACLGDFICREGRCGNEGVLCPANNVERICHNSSCCFYTAGIENNCAASSSAVCTQSNSVVLGCDDPTDCAAGEKCCGQLIVVDTTIKTYCTRDPCAGLLVCASQADCPSGKTCQPRSDTYHNISVNLYFCL